MVLSLSADHLDHSDRSAVDRRAEYSAQLLEQSAVAGAFVARRTAVLIRITIILN